MVVVDVDVVVVDVEVVDVDELLESGDPRCTEVWAEATVPTKPRQRAATPIVMKAERRFFTYQSIPCRGDCAALKVTALALGSSITLRFPGARQLRDNHARHPATATSTDETQEAESRKFSSVLFTFGFTINRNISDFRVSCNLSKAA